MKVFELFEENTNSVEQSILRIFNEVISEYSEDLKCQSKKDGNWLIIEFFNVNKKYAEQTLSIKLTKLEDGFDLTLSDVYVPVSLRNKGFLTKVLSKIRKIPGMSGRLIVSVGMNQEKWKNITQKAGFTWGQNKVSLPWDQDKTVVEGKTLKNAVNLSNDPRFSKFEDDFLYTAMLDHPTLAWDADLPEETIEILKLIPTQGDVEGKVDNDDPILVVRRFGQNFVIDGHHRIYTAMKNKKKTIQAVILEMPDENVDLNWFRKKLRDEHLGKTSENGYGFKY